MTRRGQADLRDVSRGGGGRYLLCRVLDEYECMHAAGAFSSPEVFGAFFFIYFVSVVGPGRYTHRCLRPSVYIDVLLPGEKNV